MKKIVAAAVVLLSGFVHSEGLSDKKPSCQLAGKGWLRHEPGARIGFHVFPGTPGLVRYILTTPPNITWWKSMSVILPDREWRIETKDAHHEATMDVTPSTPYRLELWKGGFGGFGANALTLHCDSQANLGSTVVVTWVED